MQESQGGLKFRRGVSRDHVMLLHSVDHVASPHRFTSTTAHNSIATTQQWQPPPPNERMASSQSPMVPIRPYNPRKSRARPQRYKTHHSRVQSRLSIPQPKISSSSNSPCNLQAIRRKYAGPTRPNSKSKPRNEPQHHQSISTITRSPAGTPLIKHTRACVHRNNS